jgi:hypothetical protein
MSVYFKPWGGMETASSRLRVLNVVPHMDASLELPEEYKKGDVLIIQKALAMSELLKAQSQGAKVIYDIDDNYMDQKPFVDMGEAADMVTVGSSFFRRYYPDAPVIDDSLDWDGTEKKEYKEDGMLVGWHGYGNLGYIFQIAPVLSLRGFNIRTIVGKDFIDSYKHTFDAKEWDLSTIDKYLAECDLCCIYLPDDDFSQAQGLNKLIKSWAIGLPTFVSPMPEYERVMQEAGIDGFIVKDDEWGTHDLGKPWVPAMREYALRFRPEAIAKQWESAISLL